MDHEAIEEKGLAVHPVFGWTCSDAAILSGGTLTCMASALTFPPSLTMKVEAAGYSETSKTQLTARGGKIPKQNRYTLTNYQ